MKTDGLWCTTIIRKTKNAILKFTKERNHTDRKYSKNKSDKLWEYFKKIDDYRKLCTFK